jgi:hypothetical protein
MNQSINFNFWVVNFLFAVLFYSCNSNDPTKYSSGNKDNRSDSIEPSDIYVNDLPNGLEGLVGDFYQGKTWHDNNGENLLALTYGSGRTFQNRSLHGFHYIRQNGKYRLAWKMIDFVNDCEFSLICEFLNNATTITDLDKNGIAEIKLQYQLNCASEPGGNTMKLLMYENGNKRALRGVRWMDLNNYSNINFPYSMKELNADISGESDNGGRYDSDKDFRNAPPIFLDFAQREWIKYVIQAAD